MSETLLRHGNNSIDAFAYSVVLVKNGSGMRHDITSMVEEFNLFSSLNAMAMQSMFSISDGAGAVQRLGMQPGDGIETTVVKDINSSKITNRYVILGIDKAQRLQNSKVRVYQITALSPAAHYNKTATVNQSYKGTFSDVIKTISSKFLKIDNLDAEETVGQRTLLMPGKSPFKLINWMAMHAVSSENGPNSLFFFFENHKGFHFKSLRRILKDANTMVYSVGVDINRDDDPKMFYYRIQDFHHNRIGDHADRLEGGIFENELMQFNVQNQTITSKKFRYKDSYQDVQAIGTKSIVDLKHNYDPWTTPADTKAKGSRNFLMTRSDESAYGQQNTIEQKFNNTIASARLFNQISFSFVFLGNPSLNVGDILDVQAPSLTGETTPSLDPLMTGKFLVSNLRHRIWGAENFVTIVDCFSDGAITNYANAS